MINSRNLKKHMLTILSSLLLLFTGIFGSSYLYRIKDADLRSRLRKPSLGDVFVNKSGLRMVWVPPGVLQDFGNVKGDRRVAVGGFWMSSCLVSRRSYLEFVGNVNAPAKGRVLSSANGMKFAQANSYCVELNEKERGFGDKYGVAMKYRLPTEFELAYAFRQKSDDLLFDIALNLEDIFYFRGVYCEWTDFDPRWKYEKSEMKCIRGRIGKPVLGWYKEDFVVKVMRSVCTEEDENPSVGFRVVCNCSMNAP